jgi:HAD superfamily hydrolase (TIGR01509 family)
VRFAAIIYDFDGVIADSEALGNQVLAEHVSALGLPMTMELAVARYMGRRWPEAMAMIAADLGRALPDNFSEGLQRAIMDRFGTDLREVPGATAFIRRFAHLPRCVASSSSTDRLALCVEKLAIAEHFAGAVFSADMVERGKPHPDIFLHAARQLGVAPETCLVVEDSPSGISAAKAAGMTALGLVAGSHIAEGHASRLIEAGADHIAGSWAEVEVWIGQAAGRIC